MFILFSLLVFLIKYIYIYNQISTFLGYYSSEKRGFKSERRKIWRWRGEKLSFCFVLFCFFIIFLSWEWTIDKKHFKIFLYSVIIYHQRGEKYFILETKTKRKREREDKKNANFPRFFFVRSCYQEIKE